MSYSVFTRYCVNVFSKILLNCVYYFMKVNVLVSDLCDHIYEDVQTTEIQDYCLCSVDNTCILIMYYGL